MNIGALEKEVLALPLEDRARLAERLLESLDNPSEQETEQLWLDEAERRVEEIDEGKVKLISSEEFERRVQAR